MTTLRTLDSDDLNAIERRACLATECAPAVNREGRAFVEDEDGFNVFDDGYGHPEDVDFAGRARGDVIALVARCRNAESREAAAVVEIARLRLLLAAALSHAQHGAVPGEAWQRKAERALGVGAAATEEPTNV